jgi:hypothetical protein
MRRCARRTRRCTNEYIALRHRVTIYASLTFVLALQKWPPRLRFGGLQKRPKDQRYDGHKDHNREQKKRSFRYE